MGWGDQPTPPSSASPAGSPDMLWTVTSIQSVGAAVSDGLNVLASYAGRNTSTPGRRPSPSAVLRATEGMIHALGSSRLGGEDGERVRKHVLSLLERLAAALETGNEARARRLCRSVIVTMVARP